MVERPILRDEVDDCWNRIGIHGDHSCERLREHVHCRNCAIYAAAARQLLDRIPLQAAARPHEPGRDDPLWHATDERALMVVVFRVAREWLALPSRALSEVASPRPIHGLPHRRDRAVLGLTNVRGNLTVCVSLVRLLELEQAPATGVRERAEARMLVFGGQDRKLVLPVDEVSGMHSVSATALEALPSTVAQAPLKYSRGVIRVDGRAVGLLDDSLLAQALERSLA
ncbi:chemotaxis protein CheW [Bordetella genomosp. 1]|uniref:Chemotaxis protein CheW n=1 Tax=Bordetella genomosp. 1 TaxID=1395607 RepID=A0A261S6Y7_9BORD|nr:chemotaxis protein CheW [Bordetella genomosp. 1]OZI33119.1 chemotaxis protein CheW [Bordetella genomosp. 1]OZI57226.1 chemotaxis protein CheW [Bordetella genomosp. 1]